MRLEALSPLPKAIRPDLATEPNVVVARHKTIPKGANIVRSYCTTGLNSL